MINFLKNLFTSTKQSSGTKTLASFEEFPKLDAGERIRQIIFCGDSANHQYYPLLKYAILQDPDPHVKMAALKRIHLFADHPDIIQMIGSAKEKIDVKAVEPYYSMALSRLGVISIEEFQERVNNGFK